MLPWEAFREATKEIKAVRGTLALGVKSLSGPLEKPDKWRFEAGGAVKGLVVETSLLPGPVKVPRGSFQANRKSIFIEGVRASLLDAECIVGGRLDGYVEGLQRMEWKVNGTVGPEANRWVSEQIELPAEFRLRAPYKVSEAVFKWEKGKDSLVRGTLLSPLGPRVSVDLVLGPETVVVNDLSIEDEVSKASFGLKEAEGAFSAAFRGGLEKATLDDLLQDNQILTGRIEGNLETKILRDHPMDSAATGTLRGEGLSLSLPIGVPVILEDFSLRGQGRQLTIERARLMQEEEEFVLGGDVSFSSEGVVLDMDFLAGDLDWDYIQEALGLEEEADDALQQVDSGNQKGLDGLTVEGVVRVKADTFTFEQFTWRPVEVEILLQQEGFEILLKETDLCGVSTAGTLKVLPEQLAIDLEISCRKRGSRTSSTVSKSMWRQLEDFSFRMKLTGEAGEEEFLRSLQGDFELDCRKGTILHDPFLSAVLAFISTKDIFNLRLPDYAAQGFAYNSIQAHGSIQQGGVIFEEVVIDGTTVDIYAIGEIDMLEGTLDARVLASSFETVDSIVSKIPLVSYLFGGGGVTAVPVRVHGPVDDLRTVPLSPKVLGEDLVGIMERTVSLPYAAIKWVLPKQEKQAEVQ